MAASDFDIELNDLFEQSVGRLLVAEVFDKLAFLALKDYFCRKAEEIKSEHVVSKQVIRYLLTARNAIIESSQFVEEARVNILLADELYLILNLMAIGEGCSDRVPGVPRIS